MNDFQKGYKQGCRVGFIQGTTYVLGVQIGIGILVLCILGYRDASSTRPQDGGRIGANPGLPRPGLRR